MAIVDFSAGARGPVQQAKERSRQLLRSLTWAARAVAATWLLLLVLHLPRDVDAPLSRDAVVKMIDYYGRAYSQPGSNQPSAEDDKYVKIAEAAAQRLHIKEKVEEFVAANHLQGKRVLDVGAGRGYLQDVVDDYTALDISTTARRFFHKPFVLGSATAMPFGENEFDVLWSIWVLEHVQNPEQALKEMRRVVRPGGIIYLKPAWHCEPWFAGGYGSRAYSELNWGGRLIKASIPLRVRLENHFRLPGRLARLGWALTTGSPTRFHYQRLKPNYEVYWGPDSDAVNWLDDYEAALWFLSRGDQCLNCAGKWSGVARRRDVLIIRVGDKRL